jgi:TonB family protein
MPMFSPALFGPTTGSVLRGGPMVFSLLTHAAALVLALLGPVSSRSAPPLTLYDEVIRARRSELVWYSFPQKLPPVSPAENQKALGGEFTAAAPTIAWDPKRNIRWGQRIQRPFPLVTPRRPAASPNILVRMPPVVEAPTLDLAAMPSSNMDIAVLGLNPATKLAGSPPDASFNARFSAAPAADGGTGEFVSVPGAELRVPSLVTREGPPQKIALAKQLAVARAAPTSREILEAAAQSALHNSKQDAAEIHLAPPPDPTFDGRDVYTFAVQMPNITSYAGSWIMWFAEHEPLGPRQELQPPVPIRKVDPKYFRSAIAEHVNGKVVIAGVLQTDGRIREIRILKGVDARLDLSAARALLKWEFVPAQRNGIPVEMDIIAEIPFLLAPEARRK